MKRAEQISEQGKLHQEGQAVDSLIDRQRRMDSSNWDDWRWHLANRIRTIEGLREWICPTPDEIAGIKRTEGRYKWHITPYYASLMDPENPSCPVRRQAIPSLDELEPAAHDTDDPVGDTLNRKTNRIIHAYQDRVAFLVTDQCPVLCRFCTRKKHTTDRQGTYYEDRRDFDLQRDLDYLRRNKGIRDVLLTGGDPLSLSDRQLDYILSSVRAIPHIEIIRIGTRYPVLLPQRLTAETVSMIASHAPVWVNTHFNHEKELTEVAVDSCSRLVESGIPVGNQTVLLAGINDDSQTMLNLKRRLLQARIRPYYLYHCDSVEGVSHFQTSLEKGRSIMQHLRASTSGLAIPQYIATTLAGKIPLEESSIQSVDDQSGSTLRLVSPDGVSTEFRIRDSY